MQCMEFIYLYRSISVCVTVLRLCTSASLLSVQLHVHLCVCEVPPARGAGLLRSAPGAGPVPCSRFSVPGSWFPSTRRRGITWPWGTMSPWPGRSRCSAPLKVSVGPPAPVRASPGRAWYRSDRTDGRTALGLPEPASPPDLRFREVYPSSLPGAAAAAGEGRALPGCRTPPPGRAELFPQYPLSFPRLGTHGCRLSLFPAGGVLRLREGGGPCMDTSPHFVSLCQLLESVLCKGLRRE